MHASFLSLAIFAVAATAAPSAPRPHGDPFNSFPFNPAAGAGSLQMAEPGPNGPDLGNQLSIPQDNSSPAPTAAHAMAPQSAMPVENIVVPTPNLYVPSAPVVAVHPTPTHAAAQPAGSNNMPAHHHAMTPSSSSSGAAAPSTPAPTPSQPASGLAGLLEGLPLLGGLGLRR